MKIRHLLSTGALLMLALHSVALAQCFTADPSEIDFGTYRGVPILRLVQLTNTSGEMVRIVELRTLSGSDAFAVVDQAPLTIFPGGRLDLRVEARGSGVKDNVDTLIIASECNAVKIPLRSRQDDPCINVHDLDFGTLAVGEARTQPLRICNDGGGELRFGNPSGGDVIEWLQRRYTVAPSELAKIENAVLGAGECIQFAVSFSSTEVGRYVDTARIWASTRRCRDISAWRATVADPGPQITGFDWQKRLITEGECERTAATEYEAEVSVFNTDYADLEVEELRLVGTDAESGHFSLGTTHSIRPGDRIRPATLPDTPFLRQTVIFKPGPDERIYYAIVELTTTSGKVVTATLRGEGIHPHIQAPLLADFGDHAGPPSSVREEQSIFVRTDGTKDVTITDVMIIPDDPASAGVFTILNRAGVIGEHAKNSAIQVQLLYAPTRVGKHAATLHLLGDFGNCDDSTTALVGQVGALSARPYGHDFASTLTCMSDTGVVCVENDGSDAITVQGITQNGDNVFSVELPTSWPVRILPGERFCLDMTFAPMDTGSYAGSMTFDVRDGSGVVPVLSNGEPIVANFSGTGRRAEALTAHIPRTYDGIAGAKFDVEVLVDRSVPEARIDALAFSMRYAHGMMNDEIDVTRLHELVRGTLLEGWTISMSTPPAVDSQNDTMTVMFLEFVAPTGTYLEGTGTAIKIPFVIFCGSDANRSELPFTLTPVSRMGCLSIETSPGLATVQCQSEAPIDLRAEQVFASHELIVSFTNPHQGSLSVGLYNSLGELVADLGGDLSSNEPRIVLRTDTSGLPTGQYYVRLLAGDIDLVTKVMILP